MTPADLRVWRTRHELTQDSLASQLGVHINTVNRWETGATAIPGFLSLALETLERQPVQNGDTPMPRRKQTASPPQPQPEELVTAAAEGEALPGITDGVVAASCGGQRGSWYCATHQAHLANGLQKDIHIDDARTHRLAWVCFVHGFEVP